MTEVEQMDLASEDLVADRIERMRSLFPEVFVESGLGERERERERVKALRA